MTDLDITRKAGEEGLSLLWYVREAIDRDDYRDLRALVNARGQHYSHAFHQAAGATND